MNKRIEKLKQFLIGKFGNEFTSIKICYDCDDYTTIRMIPYTYTKRNVEDIKKVLIEGGFHFKHYLIEDGAERDETLGGYIIIHDFDILEVKDLTEKIMEELNEF